MTLNAAAGDAAPAGEPAPAAGPACTAAAANGSSPDPSQPSTVEAAFPGSFCAELWHSTKDVYSSILAHPFLRGLVDGSLPEAAFRFYIVQDVLYLRQYGRSLALVASKAPRPEWAAFLCRCGLEALEVEMGFHEEFLHHWGSDTAAETAGAVPCPNSLLYTSWVTATAHERAFYEGLAAVLPCFVVYLEVGKALKQLGSPHPAYASWIAKYGGDEFESAVLQTVRMVNEVASELGDAQRERMRALFRQGCRLEYMFWDGAWKQQQWPVYPSKRRLSAPAAMLRCGAGAGLAPSLQGASGGTGGSQAVAAFVALARALSGAHLQAVAAGGGGAARAERRWFSSQAAPVEAEEAETAPRACSGPSSAATAASEPAAAAAPLSQPASSAAGAGAAAARDAHLRAAVAGFTDAVSSAGMSLAAALMQKQHRGKPPGIAELAVEVLERMRQAGMDEAERLASLLSNPQSLREQQRARRVMPQLELIFGTEGAEEVASKRPAVLGSSPATIRRALAAMAMCGVQSPLALARRSPILLQYCHDSESLVTARLALQHYLGLSAAEVYRTYPSYLLPAPRTLACRLQYLADLGRLQLLVPSRAAALRQWRQQAAAEAAAAGGQAPGPAVQAAPRRRGRRRKDQAQATAPAVAAAAAAAAPGTGQLHPHRGAQLAGSRFEGPPPYLTLSHVVKQRVDSFCRYAQLDEAAFRAFQASFSSHPAWLALQQRGRAEAAHLTRLLDEMAAAAAAAQDEPAAAGRRAQ